MKPNHFKMIRILGKGTYAKVYLASHKKSNETFAIKIMDKDKDKDKDKDRNKTTKNKNNINSYAEYEAKLHMDLSLQFANQIPHKNIIQCYDYFIASGNIYLVLEYIGDTTLLDELNKYRFLGDIQTAKYIRQLLSAIGYCHYRGIIHHDIKLENILVSPAGQIKLIDFGLSTYISDIKVGVVKGTVDYMPPEIIKSLPYGTSVDIWSIGILTYELLFGYPPFRDETDVKVVTNILNYALEFENPQIIISDLAKQFILDVLQYRGDERPTCDQLLFHPWILHMMARED